MMIRLRSFLFRPFRGDNSSAKRNNFARILVAKPNERKFTVFGVPVFHVLNKSLLPPPPARQRNYILASSECCDRFRTFRIFNLLVIARGIFHGTANMNICRKMFAHKNKFFFFGDIAHMAFLHIFGGIHCRPGCVTGFGNGLLPKWILPFRNLSLFEITRVKRYREMEDFVIYCCEAKLALNCLSTGIRISHWATNSISPRCRINWFHPADQIRLLKMKKKQKKRMCANGNTVVVCTHLEFFALFDA